MRTQAWKSDVHGELSEASVRRRYNENLHRVFVRHMPEAAEFAGQADERLLVLLEGRFSITWGSKTETLAPGDMVEIPAGPFIFSSQGPVTFMAVYRLPAELWPN